MRPASPLGFEPPMFRGLSGTELTATIGLSLLPGIPLGILICMGAGSWLWVLPVLVASAFCTVLLMGSALRRIKRNRPPNWHLQYVARYGAAHLDLIWRDGSWRIDR